MDTVTLAHAKLHLEELIERAAKGEDVRISDPRIGTVRLAIDTDHDADSERPRRPILGQWKGRLTIPERLFEPLNEDELAWLSGENSP